MRIASLFLASILLTGCATGTTTDTGAAPEPSNSGQSPSAPEPTDEPDTETGEEVPPESASDSQPCEDLMFQRAQGTIRSQQAALAESDFEAARAFASNSFRSTVTVEQFQEIIEGNFAFLLEDPAITFVECQRRGDTALIRVDVAGSPVTVLVYGMVLEDDMWFVDAASIAGNREDVTA